MAHETKPGASTRSGIRETAEAARDSVTEAAGRAAEQARDTAAEKADDTRHRVSGAVNRLARAFDDAAEDMSDNGPAAPALKQAAASARRAAELIDERDIGDIVDGTERFARQNPGLFLGAAALTGFALARFATARPDTHWDDDARLDPVPAPPPEPVVPAASHTYPAADPLAPSPAPAAPHVERTNRPAPGGMGTV